MLGLAFELSAQLRVLRGDADGAGVEVTLAHHDAAHRNERRRAQTDLFGAEQTTDDNVTSGLHLAVRLQDDTASKVVHHQCLVSLGNAELPRKTGVLDRRQR